jgi:Ni,Fe-hydrogenase I cytochrome b subunit
MIRPCPVWDAPTRWCRWINVVTVPLLVLSGFLFMYRYSLQIESPEANAAIQMVRALVAGTPLNVAEADRGS